MFGVELYGRVRLAVFRDGLSYREAARRFGIDRGTVAKMARHPEPPGYRRSAPVRRPKLEAHVGFIDEILRTDLEAPRKQRRTVRRIFERLRDARGFDGGCTTVRDDVRPRRRRAGRLCRGRTRQTAWGEPVPPATRDDHVRYLARLVELELLDR